MQVKAFDQKRQNYEAPKMEVIEIETQGVLCASGDGGGNEPTPAGATGNGGIHFGTTNGNW